MQKRKLKRKWGLGMEKENKKEKKGFWYTVASFIVDKRKAILIVFVFAFVYCLVNFNRVRVNQDITKYLPEASETRIGISTMGDEFVTYGSARVMVANVTYDQANKLAVLIEAVPGVKEVAFDGSADHYTGTNALFDVTVNWEDKEQASIEAMDRVKTVIDGYDYYISTTIGQEEESARSLAEDMNVILVLAVVIIVAVLLVSTKSFAEIPVLLITFGGAAILNKGTNFWMGEISSVTNSIAIVLQLALAIDYAIILCDRYMEEHEILPPAEAVKVALSKAIPEISSSCLTTVSGMVAMMFMQFKLGYDMGIILVKAILCSLIAVFFLMPAVILIFSKAMDKTGHRSFVPKITFLGKFAAVTKWIIPPVFVVVIVLAAITSNNCTYLYNVDSVESAKKSEQRIATEKIESTFGATNQLVVMVPIGDYESEAKALRRIENLDYVISALGLANQDINDDYTLTQKLTPRQFAELTDIDAEIVELLYAAYAYDQEEYGPVVTGINEYGVPIIDMFLFLYDEYSKGYIKLSSDLDETLTSLYDKLYDAELQLRGENYTRFVLNLDCPVEGQEVYDAMDEIRGICSEYYGDNVILVGNSTSCYDLQSTFATDNLIISILTILFVVFILFFTFQSAGLPILLVLTIQGSIWINFTVPTIEGQGIYFIAYLIISAIQMGATIDYAIVISSRYMALKKELPLKDAITETLNQAFPTIFTSGSILACAGFLIGNISSDATVAAIGIALGRGTLISIIIVLCALPQILLLGDVIIEKTALTINLAREQKEITGKIAVVGHVHGYVQGMIDADVNGSFQGDMRVAVDSILPSKRGDVQNDNEQGIIPQLPMSECLHDGKNHEIASSETDKGGAN